MKLYWYNCFFTKHVCLSVISVSQASKDVDMSDVDESSTETVVVGN